MAASKPAQLAERLGRLLAAIVLALGVASCGAPGPQPSERAADADASAGPLAAVEPTMELEAGVPVFSWDAVDGAEAYAVLVYEGDAESPSWFWVGETTTVRYGDLPSFGTDLLTSADLPEPSASPETSPVPADAEWQVVAMGADGSPIAISPREPLE